MHDSKVFSVISTIADDAFVTSVPEILDATRFNIDALK